MPENSRSLSDRWTADERAELHALRDLAKRFVSFGGDDAVLMPWVDAHRHHADQPYMGCVFCRDQFVSIAEVERLLREVDRNFAGAHVNAGVAIGAVRRALREALNGGEA